MTFAAEGGAPAQGVWAGTFLVMVGAILAAIFLGLARVWWRQKAMVVRQHLFSWPIGFAALFLLLFAVSGWLEGPGPFWVVIATAGAGVGAGVAAAAPWLELSYANEKNRFEIPLAIPPYEGSRITTLLHSYVVQKDERCPETVAV